VVVMMYMQEGVADTPRVRISPLSLAALAIAGAAIVYLGILPTRVLDLAAQSIATIF